MKNFRPPQIAIKTDVVAEIDRLTRKYDRNLRQVMFKLGAYVRRSMRNSMRYKQKSGKVSPPGSPPKALKENPLLRRGIGFTVARNSKNVVIGPDRFDKRKKTQGRTHRESTVLRGKTVPQLLDEGGEVRMRLLGEELWPANNWNAELPGTDVVAVYKPRPFVAPARVKGEERFLELLADNLLR